MNNAILKNILVIVGLLAVAIGGYYIFLQKDSSALNLETIDSGDYQTMLIRTQVFIERQRELSSIDMDTSILDDARFFRLQSNTEPLENIDVGRVDPFADTNGS